MNDLSNAQVFSEYIRGLRSWNEISQSDQYLAIFNITIFIITLISIGIYSYKKRKKRLNEIRIKREARLEHTPREITYNQQHLELDTLKNIETIKEYLDNSLDKLFNQFVITRLLFIFKQFGSISIENAQKTKQEFIDQFEASLTMFEKEQFKKAFDNFPAFKLYVIQFYNIKLVKLELLITHKIEINESEFKDYILINSLCNDINKKEIKNILDILK